MKIKSLIPYKINKPLNIDTESLSALIEKLSFCDDTENFSRERSGFSPIIDIDGEKKYVVEVNEYQMILFRKDIRDVPKSELDKIIKTRSEEFEKLNGRLPSRPERATFRDDAFASLLPRAFPKSHYVKVFIDKKRNWLLVEAGSAKRAEEANALLRRAIESLPVTPFLVKESVEFTLTESATKNHGFLGKTNSSHFLMREKFQVVNKLNHNTTSNLKGVEVESEEMIGVMESGIITKANMLYKNKEGKEIMEFTLYPDISMRSIKMLNDYLDNVILATSHDSEKEKGIYESVQAEILILCNEATEMLETLIAIFGGIDE